MTSLVSGVTALCPSLTATVVKEIIDTDLADAVINAFINTAYYQAYALTGKLGACGNGDAHCEIIKYLAAHYIAMTRERQTKSESIAGEWSATFMGQDGLSLNATTYGQTAIALDCSGALATAAAGLKKAEFAVVAYEDIDDAEPGGW
jgi:hypothetical protein